MSLEDLKAKIVRLTEEIWLKGNVDAMNELFAPDIVLKLYPFPDIKGLEAAKQGVRMQLQAYTNLGWDTEEIIGEGNTIVWRYTLHGKHTGVSPTIPFPPSGKELVMKSCDVYHLKDGKIIECLGYRDYLGMLQQMGVVPLLKARSGK